MRTVDLGSVAAATTVAPAGVTATWIGTATTLLDVGGFALLTDPNFLHRGQSARLGFGLRSRRLTDPALDIADLPSLDLVVLSHFHGDHFDDVAACRLDRAVPVATTHHAQRMLRRLGFAGARGLDTYDEVVLHRGARTLRVTAVPARHGPALVHRLLPPVLGSVLDLYEGAQRLVRVYVTGDTMPFAGIDEIARRFPDIDLALVHLGGTRIAGLLLTMDGSAGLELLDAVRPRTTVPIHHGDYGVFRSPLADFLARVRAAGIADCVVPLERGESTTVVPAAGR